MRVDETQSLLRAIMARLEEMSADMKGLRTDVAEIKAEVKEIHGRLDHLDLKWMEHDREIWRLKHKQA